MPNLSTDSEMQSSPSLTDVINEPGAEWEECEAAIDKSGTPLPLFHRAVWARARKNSGARAMFISIRDSRGVCRAGFAIESEPSRALPGHRLLAVRRLVVGSGGLAKAPLDAGIAALAATARADQSVLRVTVQSFTLDAESRDLNREVLCRHGFRQVPTTLTYERTLMMDLTPHEDEVFSRLSRSARRNIRNLAKYPATIALADSVSLSARLQDLYKQTQQRTGGEQHQIDWAAFIRLSAEAPHLSRIAILKRTDREGPQSILAFAWGCMHGNICEYFQSGSSRPDDLKIPTNYALLWDLVSWARRTGARSFDLGGVTAGTESSGDPLGGISDFKRHFTQQELEVGGQWQLEPHPARAAAARIVSRGAALLRRTAARKG